MNFRGAVGLVSSEVNPSSIEKLLLTVPRLMNGAARKLPTPRLALVVDQ